MNTTRILSFDGGFASPLQLRLLRLIEQDNPGFLAKTDLFAGVSDGASASLFLAMKLGQDPDGSVGIIDEAIAFSNQLIRALHVSLCALAEAAIGVGSLSKVQPFQDALQKAYGDTTLGQLTRKVAVVSFDVNTKKRVIFGSRDIMNAYAEVPLYEVNWASGALPLFAPLYPLSINGHYFADGGLVDNNPSMAALVGSLSWQGRENDLVPPDLFGQKLLSLGCTPKGRIARFTDPDSIVDRLINLLGTYSPLLGVPTPRKPRVAARTWGYLQWLLQGPMSLPILLANADVSGVDAQCTQLLRANYRRYAPAMAQVLEGALISFACPSTAIASYDAMAWKYSGTEEFAELKRWVKDCWCAHAVSREQAGAR